MSHFLTLVFIPSYIVQQGTRAVIHEAHRLMMPYDLHPTPGGDNPDGAWDGWEIGGRWHGTVARGSSIDRDSGSISEADDLLLAMNSCRVQDLPYDLVPFAIITPDGILHAEGEMQEFGFAANLDPYWEDKYDRFREQYADSMAVALDCHI
jgi:hypothetical protein